MATLAVIAYDGMYGAEETRLALRRRQQDHLVDVDDAVVAVRDATGKVTLHQAVTPTAAGMTRGDFWGVLVGLIFLNPRLGMAVGASAGAVQGALTDVGLDDRFMQELAAGLSPRRSALFVLVRKATPERVLEALQGTGGPVLQTVLTHENVARLQAALSVSTRRVGADEARAGLSTSTPPSRAPAGPTIRRGPAAPP